MRSRAEIVADDRLVGVELCAALCEWADTWLGQLFAAATAQHGSDGFALVAVGGYGRGELSPHSDLDLLLLHRPSVSGDAVRSVAEGIWYPIWDAGLKLGHAVRTVDEAVGLAADDLDTATSLLDCRHLAGEPGLADELAQAARERWRKKRRRRLVELARSVAERHERAGEVAFLLEPDVKEGRGGLRDVHALRWARAAGVTIPDGGDAELASDHDTLVAVRVELHRRAGRPGDVLLLEQQDAIAAAFGIDADELMRRVATAARAVAWRADAAWSAIEAELARGFGRSTSREVHLGGGVARRGERMGLAADADLADPVLPLRLAAAAASADLPLEREALDRLVAVPALPEPWPAEARERFVELLGAGRPAIRTVEALDHRGIWPAVLPEWAEVHSKPQRNAYHRFTVDRHLLEAAANAASLTGRVDRPDLLLVGALLHDIGKGRPGDHTEVGIEMVGEIGRRMGFPDDDVDDLVQMVRHHLLLPDVATRRDLEDDGTIRTVAEAVGTPRVLHLLHALTEADSLATGPAAWGEWKAELVAQLVERVDHLFAGTSLDAGDSFPTAEHRSLMATGQRHVIVRDDVLTVIDVDRPALFSKVAGVLALHGAGILAASAHSAAGGAVAELRVLAPTTRELPWDRIAADLGRALDGRLAVSARLAERIGTYRRSRSLSAHPVTNRVVVDNDVSDAATVVEVHTEDRMGVLYRITGAIAELGLDIRSARVQTLGHEVVDAFYLLDPHGQKLVDPDAVEAVEVAILHALETAP